MRLDELGIQKALISCIFKEKLYQFSFSFQLPIMRFKPMICLNNLVIQGHHGWWAGAFIAINLKSGYFVDNSIFDTDVVMWIEATSGLKYRGNTVYGTGRWGLDVNGNSVTNVIDVNPGELDEFVPTEYV